VEWQTRMTPSSPQATTGVAPLHVFICAPATLLWVARSRPPLPRFPLCRAVTFPNDASWASKQTPSRLHFRPPLHRANSATRRNPAALGSYRRCDLAWCHPAPSFFPVVKTGRHLGRRRPRHHAATRAHAPYGHRAHAMPLAWGRLTVSSSGLA
jgi:hypothetical protein